MRRAAALALLLAAGAASAAIDYSRFAHPRGDYVFEYPSGWKRSVGLQAVLVRPPGAAGQSVSVTLERYPLGKDSPATPEEFEKRLMADVGGIKRLDGQGVAEVAGRKARRVALTTTAQLKGPLGAPLPGPRKELYFILPQEKGFYYVLKLVGFGASFDAQLPEFGRIAERLKLGSPSPVPIR